MLVHINHPSMNMGVNFCLQKHLVSEELQANDVSCFVVGAGGDVAVAFHMAFSH